MAWRAEHQLGTEPLKGKVEALKTNDTTPKYGQDPADTPTERKTATPRHAFHATQPENPGILGQVHDEAPSQVLIEKVHLFFKQE